MKPVLLCILDGWGDRADAPDNAISQGNTPCWDRLNSNNSKSLLETSGLAVGLPAGQMGNSEVGHMNIGSGRVVMQNLPKIDKAIADGSIKERPELTGFIDDLKKTGGVCHIAGLMSPGGVHSHQNHIAVLAKTMSDAGVEVKIHAFLDGRDVPPASAAEYMANFDKAVDGYNVNIATISGRYYAMDRDNRWDRVKLAYNAIIAGEGANHKSHELALKDSYAADIYDEFVKPCVLSGYKGAKDADGFLMANFRSDRAREILDAVLNPDFEGFARGKVVSFSSALGMVEYSSKLNKFIAAAFKSEQLKNILGEVISQNGLKQLRVAETEKYAHVTFFFNGGREEEFDGEERVLIPSPDVATYDLQPEMSAREVTDELVKAIESNKFDLIVVNYANTDMVGHTGIQSAAIKAVEAIDECLARLVSEVENAGGIMFITADHGNSEQMADNVTGQPHTSHTTNPVPFVLAGKDVGKYRLKNGSLCDIAPTILKVMNIEQPVDMTGEVLISE